MSELVLYDRSGPAAVITLNRPEKRNALNRELIGAIGAAFDRADADSSVRAVILTGSGKAFCAGMDLDEVRTTTDPEQINADAQSLSALYTRIDSLTKPTIAAINGPAVAGGAGLVSVCDLAVADRDAKLGYPEVRRGLVAAMVLPYLLRNVQERAARYLLLTGELIGGEAAVESGLVNAVVSADQVLATAHAWAGLIAQGGPQALAATRMLLRRFTPTGPTADELAAASAQPRQGDECRAGLEAFFNNRPVPWLSGS